MKPVEQLAFEVQTDPSTPVPDPALELDPLAANSKSSSVFSAFFGSGQFTKTKVRMRMVKYFWIFNLYLLG
jgi:hypothetical protein